MPRCAENIDHSWPPEKWRWSPDLGRWSPEYGMPNQPIVFQISTSPVRQEEAYEYWRNIALYNFEADRLPESRKRTFSAQATVLATSQGTLSTYQSCSISGHRSVHESVSDGCQTFTVGLVLEGRRWHRDETNDVYIATPGDLFCYDGARTSRVVWTDPREVLLTLPRATIEAAIGNIPSATALSKALSNSNFAPFLQAHFRTVSDALKYLNPAERTAAFQHSVDLVLTALREALRPDVTSYKFDRAIHFFTAKQLILQQLSPTVSI